MMRALSLGLLASVLVGATAVAARGRVRASTTRHVRCRLCPPDEPPERRRWWLARPGVVGSAGEVRAVRGDLPGSLERLARALRSGTSLPEGLRAAAVGVTPALELDLRRAASRLDAGVGRSDVLAEWARRRPTREITLAVAALGLGTDVGGSRARAVDRVAVGLRAREAVARETVALSAQARLSALVIVVSPLVFAALGLVGDPAVARFLVATPVGLGCLMTGLLLDAAGLAWMRRVVAGAAP